MAALMKLPHAGDTTGAIPHVLCQTSAGRTSARPTSGRVVQNARAQHNIRCAAAAPGTRRFKPRVIS